MSQHDSQDDNLKYFGIAPWRLVPLEPRHNTWHNALFDNSIKNRLDLEYIGLRNNYKTNYITQILPDSILKRFPYINLFHFLKLVRKLKLHKGKKTLIYIFEGSIFWYIILSCIRYFIPNCVVVCNLFPSSRYNVRFFNSRNKLPYRIFFYLVKWQCKKSVYITFDTQLMVNKVNSERISNLFRFPVPSSFSYRIAPDLETKSHYRVLVNMRAFPEEKLHDLLKSSCQQCTFVFPRGTLKSQPLEVNFGHYTNTYFDDKVIPITDYEFYVDQHDYMIFLYQPSIDASGRILDAIARGIPVCVPKQASEWAEIAKQYGQLFDFDWNSMGSLSTTFNHPTFSKLTYIGEPPFTPSNVLAEFTRILTNSKLSRIRLSLVKKVLVLIFIFFHSLIASNCSIFYQILFRLKSFYRSSTMQRYEK